MVSHQRNYDALGMMRQLGVVPAIVAKAAWKAIDNSATAAFFGRRFLFGVWTWGCSRSAHLHREH